MILRLRANVLSRALVLLAMLTGLFVGLGVSAAQANPPPPASSVVQIGDSLTTGMQAAGLADSYRSLGYVPVIDAASGRGVSGGPGPDGIAAINQHCGEISRSNLVVMELGTNRTESDFQPAVSSAIDAIHACNGTVNIDWVNLGVAGPDAAVYSSRNQVLQDLSGPKRFKVDNWFGQVYPTGNPVAIDPNLQSANGWLNADPIHPSAEGYKSMVSLLTTNAAISAISLPGVRTASVATLSAPGAPTPAAPAAPASSLPAPAGLKADAQPDSSVHLSWTPIPPPADVHGYNVYRGTDRIGHAPATDYVDPHPPTRQLAYTVRGVDATGKEGAASAAASITVAAPVTPPPPSDSATSGGGQDDNSNSGDASGGSQDDFKQPGFKGDNSPTAFELYGASIGVVNDTYGTFDKAIAIKTFIIVIIWNVVASFNYLALTFLAWSVTTKLYGGLVVASGALIAAIFGLKEYGELQDLAATIGGTFLVIYILTSKSGKAKKGAVFMLLSVVISLLFSANAAGVTKKVIDFPVASGQYVLGQVDSLTEGNDPVDFNVSVKPTFRGSPYEQGVRRFQNREFLTTVYPAECKINFNDLTWATSNFVPDDGDKKAVAEGFTHLTYCEYYVRARAIDSSRLGWLQKQTKKNAPHKVWVMYQGKDPLSHWRYGGLASLVVLFRTALLFLTGGAFVLGVVMLAFLVVKFALFLIGWMIPPLRVYVNELVADMAITASLPVGLAVVLVIAIVLSSFTFGLLQSAGWVVMMFVQLVIAVATLISGWKTFKGRKERKAAAKEHIKSSDSSSTAFTPGSTGGSSGGGGGGAGSFIASGVAIGAAAYTGGTSAALAAGASSGGTATPRRAEMLPASSPRPAISSGGGGSSGGGSVQRPAISPPERPALESSSSSSSSSRPALGSFGSPGSGGSSAGRPPSHRVIDQEGAPVQSDFIDPSEGLPV